MPNGELSQNRGMARPFLMALAETAMSGAEMLDFLRSEGLGYRTQDFYRDLNSIKTGLANQEYIRTMEPSRGVPDWMMETPDSESYQMQFKFHYVFKTEIIDPKTGKPITVKRSMGADGFMTKEEATDLFTDNFPWAEESGKEELISAELIGMRKRA